ncbi:MAG: flagellar basal body rod C-terminal domain-containing protein [Rhodoferax sp.]
MDRMAFNAAVAMSEQTLSRQMSVNEMANATTTGFKRSYEAAMRSVAVEGAGLKSRFQPQSVAEDYISMKAGPVVATGNDLDVAFSGSTVLGVTAPDGTLAFTRRGDLRVNANSALENGSGALVRGSNGGAITIPPGVRVTIRADGAVFGSDPAQGANTPPVQIGTLLLRDASQTPLQRRPDALFMVAGSDPGTDIPPGPVATSLTPGALEGSNVNSLSVMVKLMDQSRSFEQQVNLIKESKTCDESGATMMKAS